MNTKSPSDELSTYTAIIPVHAAGYIVLSGKDSIRNHHK